MPIPRTPSFRLDGRRAFVPGGSRGLGFACAAALAEAGAAVTVCARDADAVDRSVQSLRDAGYDAEGASLDIGDLPALDAFLEARPAFDILCNSAGTARHGPTTDTTPDDFDAVVGVNLRAAYFVAQRIARRMPEGGSIIQISSQMGHVGGIDRSVYCATKHGVEGMTKAMAIEWGPRGIRVNTIAPTFVRTPLTQSTFDDPDRRAWIEEKIKLGRVGEVEDVMGAVVFLASAASGLVTGTSILVDGGWTAG